MKQPMLIIKRDGTTEPFSPKKLHRVARAADLNEDQADKLIAIIKRKLKATKRTKIHSHVLRDMVLFELKKVSEYAAGLYEWYEGTKK